MSALRKTHTRLMTSANVLILLADREMNSSTAADVADWTVRKDAKMQEGSDR